MDIAGANHPVKDVKTGKITITSQNHGYVIDKESIDSNIAEISQISLNDETIEGLRYKNKNILTVQYYPNAYLNEKDKSYVYDKFLKYLKK